MKDITTMQRLELQRIILSFSLPCPSIIINEKNHDKFHSKQAGIQLSAKLSKDK